MAGRCECCDKPLSYKETTARFVTAEGEPRRYTNMCKPCMSFLNVPIIMRGDLDDNEPVEDNDHEQHDEESIEDDE